MYVHFPHSLEPSEEALTASILIVAINLQRGNHLKSIQAAFLKRVGHINPDSYSSPTHLPRQAREFEDIDTTLRSYLVFILSSTRSIVRLRINFVNACQFAIGRQDTILINRVTRHGIP